MENPVILFDGFCNYCNGVVNFLIRQDKKRIFRFAALQSQPGKELLKKLGLETRNHDSFILIEDGRVYLRSEAALKLLKHLPWYWRWGKIFRLIPSFVRDAVYNVIARNRYKWFGKKDQCMVPSADVRSRFLDNNFTP